MNAYLWKFMLRLLKHAERTYGSSDECSVSQCGQRLSRRILLPFFNTQMGNTPMQTDSQREATYEMGLRTTETWDRVSYANIVIRREVAKVCQEPARLARIDQFRPPDLAWKPA